MDTLACHDDKTSRRCLWIDAARGIAILLVLLAHSQYWTFCVTNLEHDWLSYITIVMGFLQASYMPLFYVLSGYVFKERSDMLKQRFKRLIYPYMLWGGFSLLLIWVEGATPIDFMRAAGGLIYSRYAFLPLGSEENIKLLPFCSSPLWFLTSMYTSSVLFYVIIKFRKYQIPLLLGYLIITYLCSFLPILLPWSLDVAPAGALFIYTGYTIKNSKLFSRSTYWLLLFAIPLLVFYYVLVRYNGAINMSVREYGRYTYCSSLLFLCIGVLGSMLYCIICIVLQKNKIVGLLACIGRNSLSILCSHMFVYAFISVILTQYFSMFNVFHALIQYRFVIEIVLAIMFAFVLTLGSKRLRFSNWKADKNQLR